MQYAFVALSLLAIGCDKVPLLAPTSSTITLTAPTRTLPIGGSTEVSATVLESGGTPVQNGTTVHFTTTLGSMSPLEAQTHNGVATATFNAGSASGTAEIRASSGGAGGTATTGSGSTATTTATNVLQITIGSANASRIGLTASPTVVPSTGGSSTITASVFDNAGNPLTNVSVFFSTDAGTLSASSAPTDASGRASVTLTTTRKATVTATVGTGTTGSGTTTTDSRTATVTVDVNVPAGATLRCLGTGSTAAVGCTQAVGSSVTFTVDRSTTTGASAISSATIDFGDGSSANLGPVTGTTTVTHTYQSTGTYTATLRTTDAMGETATVTNTVSVTPRTPLNVSLSVSLGTPVVGVGVTATFTATVTPTTELIESYTWDFGDGTVITTSGNSTSHVYTSNGVKRATVTVRTVEGRTASASVEFIVSGV